MYWLFNDVFCAAYTYIMHVQINVQFIVRTHWQGHMQYG